MKYYLKKCWPTVTAASICMVVAYGLQVCTSLVQIQITQGLLDGDLRAFTIRIILLLLTWLAVVLCLIAETFFQGRAVRRMNNALRRDMAAGLLHKTHQEYHKQESGEYLSQFTNDVNQIEQMAWTPFFTIMGSAAQVVFGIVALASIHWLLLVISLVIALVMIFVPRLFSKRLGTVGTACAASQADSVSKIKDLLAGYDVLRFFGKDERFTSGVDAASDSMEQAKYKLTINKDGIGCGLAYVSAVCQVAVVILLGVLILNDMIPLATFMGTGTICAGVYNGLNQVSNLFFSAEGCADGRGQLTDFGLPTQRSGCLFRQMKRTNERGIQERRQIRPSPCPGLAARLGQGFMTRDVRDYTPEQLQQIIERLFLFNTTIRSTEQMSPVDRMQHCWARKATPFRPCPIKHPAGGSSPWTRRTPTSWSCS